MLYIFDLGNVIVDIDFNRVLGAWSDFSRVPLATLKQNFKMGETFHQHERGEISDEEFAERFCHEMDLPLSYEVISKGTLEASFPFSLFHIIKCAWLDGPMLL